MNPDETVCYCYDVSLRKLVNFARRERPRQPSEMSRCLGAGTGCGWCVPLLIKIAEDPEAPALEMSTEEYAAGRRTYLRSGGPRNSFG